MGERSVFFCRRGSSGIRRQLEEFERAVRSCLTEDARTRHRQFVVAIENQILTIEDSIRNLVLEDGKTVLPWVRLDEGESDELALFLTGPLPDGDMIVTIPAGKDEERNLEQMVADTIPDCSKNSCHSLELDMKETREEKVNGYRRTASASADIGTWKIAVSVEDTPPRPFDGQPDLPPKIPSFTTFTRSTESSTPKLKWLKNGFRKWKGGDCHQAADTMPLRSYQLSRGINACYEKSKSCLDSCNDESYNKQLYGWLGAVQRQLQRSQYQIQYSRPIQLAFWVILVLCLIVFFVMHSI
ncbi:syntaxin/t-SNARE family protein isoform X2 [Tasmannia lanceolata]|uniref:syntaxin/t-SNARE family protein isoform X2 n=1 Tax=Tasmannia lanceolata TaxID=3420 RepID=UPI004064C2E3